MRTVRYRGYVVTIPRSWPVYNLARDPRQCVRFDRHALYLGRPGSDQQCPAEATGRTEAILIEPLSLAPRAERGQDGSVPAVDGHASTFAVRSAGVVVTATWASSEGVVARALHRSSLPVTGSAPPPRPHLAPRVASERAAHAAAAAYEGRGFDACSTPSTSQMSAWGASPYRAIGVYIGGVNAACSQPNLTTSWVTTEVAAGWHLILTYVGLQAPTNDCGCESITPAQASAQGAAAATDAVNDAIAIGIPAGNPIYDDMEGYSRTSTNTSAVLSFLSAWTSQLHADGYLSGVYSSAASGMTDLANQAGTSYVEPDDIWFADWNGEQTTSDSYIPANDWDTGDRLHQYQGAHNETYDGTKINIDSDYLDGATADTTAGGIAQTLTEPTTPPALTLTPLANGTTDAYASWSGSVGVASWRVIGGFSPNTGDLGAVAQTAAKSSVTQIAIHNGSPYLAVQALGSSGQLLGSSTAVAMPPHITLFGPTTFVPSTAGLGATPAGCYTGKGCHVKLTLSVGRTVVAKTGTEYIAPGGGGMLYYNLTGKGRTLLERARGNRLAVTATARDASGATATTKLSMISFSTSGRGPSRHITQSPTARIINSLDYVSSGGTGGILAGCRNTIVCDITTTLKVGRTVIAQTGGEYLGANELGYLIFKLTARGRALLRSAPGNQLAAQLTLTDGTAHGTATVALIRFR